MLTAAIVIAGWLAGYLVLRWILQRTMTQMRLQLEKERKAQHESLAVGRSGRLGGSERFSQITPKSISALGETLSAFMGQQVQIRAIKKRPVSNALSNPWAREGCLVVQNSHEFEVSRSKTHSIAKPMRGNSFESEVRRKAA
jgi:hypothetical protein